MPSETPEPTQEQRATSLKFVRRQTAASLQPQCMAEQAKLYESDLQYAEELSYLLAAEAAPLREEIERLTKERNEARALKITEVMGAAKRVCDERDAAEAKAAQYERDWMVAKYEFGNAMGKAHENARSLEQQLSEERLKGEACTLDWAEKLDAAEAKVERLTKERDGARESILVYCATAIHDGPDHEGCGIRDLEARADAAEAKVPFLVAEIEKLAAHAGELHREKTNAEIEIERQHELYVGAADDTQHERRKALILEKQLAEALAAASRAREEQGALRAALDSTEIILAEASVMLRRFVEVHHADHCSKINHSGMCVSVRPQLAKIAERLKTRAALAPPAAGSRENQQQLTGKGQ